MPKHTLTIVLSLAVLTGFISWGVISKQSEAPVANLEPTEPAPELVIAQPLTALEKPPAAVATPDSSTAPTKSADFTPEQVAAFKQQAAIKYADKIAELQQEHAAIQQQYQQASIDQAEQFSGNRRARELMNIDVEEDFNVNLDQQREDIRVSMRQRQDKALMQRLADLGVPAEQRQFIMDKRREAHAHPIPDDAP